MCQRHGQEELLVSSSQQGERWNAPPPPDAVGATVQIVPKTRSRPREGSGLSGRILFRRNSHPVLASGAQLSEAPPCSERRSVPVVCPFKKTRLTISSPVCNQTGSQHAASFLCTVRKAGNKGRTPSPSMLRMQWEW